jgi:hypothetical protein
LARKKLIKIMGLRGERAGKKRDFENSKKHKFKASKPENYSTWCSVVLWVVRAVLWIVRAVLWVVRVVLRIVRVVLWVVAVLWGPSHSALRISHRFVGPALRRLVV